MRILILLLFLFTSERVTGQNDSLFNKTIKHFEETLIWAGQKIDEESRVISRDSLYQTKDYNVSISDNPIYFEIEELVIQNPFFKDDVYYEDRDKNYPVSYSIIFNEKLISLFGNGNFVVHSLNNYVRDKEFERELNTRKFNYHWIIDGRLYARTKNRLFSRLLVWSDGKWVKSKKGLPLNNKPLLFDNEQYIVFNDCFGEWGGTIYFFDRIAKDFFFTESTCANTVLYNKQRFSVLAHMGHMIGSSELKIIPDPENLSKANKNEVFRSQDGHALGISAQNSGYERIFYTWGVQFFSFFDHNNRSIYITHTNERSFLSEIRDSEIQIVHPLFDDDFYTHDAITRIYDKYKLVNLNYWGNAKDREYSVLVIDNNRIVRLEWNKDHN